MAGIDDLIRERAKGAHLHSEPPAQAAGPTMRQLQAYAEMVGCTLSEARAALSNADQQTPRGHAGAGTGAKLPEPVTMDTIIRKKAGVLR